MQMHNPAHPGAILADTLGHVSVEQLAGTLKLTIEQTEELLRGERDITPEMAERLPALYPNQPPELWLRLQKQRMNG